MKNYTGLISVENGTAFLKSGGVVMRLDGDGKTFEPLNGIIASISGEQQGDVIVGAVALPQAESLAVSSDEDLLFDQIVALIKRDGHSLKSIPGVVAVRPGYSSDPDKNFRPGIILVKEPGAPLQDVPSQLEGVPVEVRPASPLELLKGFISLQQWEGITEEAAGKPNIHYTPPTTVSLDEHNVSNITCHVGPDAGWTTLKPFLEGTGTSLTVAMYEFYAPHIKDTIQQLGEQGDAKLNMILQVDKNDRDIEEMLQDSWGDRLDFVKASVSGPNRIFNNSYHTKVAVRDSTAFWLSSGNWSPTSQPLLESESDSFVYRRGNREWHVIVEDEGLAQMYEKFILYDMDQARNVPQTEAMEVLPDLLIPESLLEAEAGIVQEHPFAPEVFAENGEKVRVQPLMSPDNYAAEVVKLIQGAKNSVYMQFAYINQPSFDTFDEIISAISEKMHDGLDVKVIVGNNQKPDSADFLIAKRKWKRSMFRKQSTKLHNKGILIDGKIVGVGSNNWSNDGTQYNRDTTLVFYSRPIAQYYTKVFLFDWENLCKPFGHREEMTPVLATNAESTPLGMIRIPWKSWFDEVPF